MYMSDKINREHMNGSSSETQPWRSLVQLGAAVVMLLVLFLGSHWFTQAGSEARSAVTIGDEPSTPAMQAAAADGADIYASRCQTCHQQNGQGVPGVFPPLDGTSWATGDKGRLIRIILGGMTGEVEVKGTTYSGSMPPWGSFLDDEQVAQVATYVRQSWSNDTSAVTVEEVAAIRKASEDRKQPWTAEELKEFEGIPGQDGDS